MKKSRTFIAALNLCLAFALAAPLAAAQSTPAKRPIALDDLVRIKGVGDPQRLAGRRVGRLHRSVDRRGKGQARHRHLDGQLGRHADRPLTFEPESETSPALEPGRPVPRVPRLARQRGGEEEGRAGLAARPGGRRSQKLTDIKGGVADYAWSPDSTRLVFVDERRRSRPTSPRRWKAGSARPPPPIVIDRYHFKQDREGYLEPTPLPPLASSTSPRRRPSS